MPIAGQLTALSSHLTLVDGENMQSVLGLDITAMQASFNLTLGRCHQPLVSILYEEDPAALLRLGYRRQQDDCQVKLTDSQGP